MLQLSIFFSPSLSLARCDLGRTFTHSSATGKHFIDLEVLKVCFCLGLFFFFFLLKTCGWRSKQAVFSPQRAVTLQEGGKKEEEKQPHNVQYGVICSGTSRRMKYSWDANHILNTCSPSRLKCQTRLRFLRRGRVKLFFFFFFLHVSFHLTSKYPLNELAPFWIGRRRFDKHGESKSMPLF